MRGSSHTDAKKKEPGIAARLYRFGRRLSEQRLDAA
jgi:hypothetical protein